MPPHPGTVQFDFRKSEPRLGVVAHDSPVAPNGQLGPSAPHSADGGHRDEGDLGQSLKEPSAAVAHLAICSRTRRPKPEAARSARAMNEPFFPERTTNPSRSSAFQLIKVHSSARSGSLNTLAPLFGSFRCVRTAMSGAFEINIMLSSCFPNPLQRARTVVRCST